MKIGVITLITMCGLMLLQANTQKKQREAAARHLFPIVRKAEDQAMQQRFLNWEKQRTLKQLTNMLLPAASNSQSGKTLNALQSAEQLQKLKTNPVFIENKGQWHNEVLYLCQMAGLDVWLTKYGINYTFYKWEKIPFANTTEDNQRDGWEDVKHNILGHRVLMRLLNHNVNPVSEGKHKQEGYYNYFIGNDHSKHATYVGRYKEVLVKDIYPDIDVRYYFDRRRLRYDYIVHAGADPSRIVFTTEGSEKTYIDSQGNLVFTTRLGEVHLTELKVYQGDDRKEIAARFIPAGREGEGAYTIWLADYDRNQSLIIDPLVYSTYLGGSDEELAAAIAVDASGNAYVTGRAWSTDYDITPGAFQTTKAGLFDVFVTKLNATGTSLVYSTYIGGTSSDWGYSIAVDDSGHAYVTGSTSGIYVITPGAFQTGFGGGAWDVFVTKLNATGTALIYSTYIGGGGNESGQSIAIDDSGNAHVTGSAEAGYPMTPGAFQTTNGGFTDVFVTKLNPSGNALVYSTFIGGAGEEIGHSIAIDSSGNAYVAGRTSSTDYDITPGAFQTSYGGGLWDVFVTQLNATGTAIIYSTYIGGSDYDIGYSITVNGNGNAHVAGRTASANYDITSGAFQTTYEGGGDAFVSKLNHSGTSLVYSTYLGGSGNDWAHSITIDEGGHACVTGQTASTNYDITTGAFQTTYGGGMYDVFVTKLNPDGTALVYSTYLGGSGADYGYSITTDGGCHLYIAGHTLSIDYDITTGAFQSIYEGGEDAFVTKLCPGVNMTISLASLPGTDNQTVCVNNPIANIIYLTTCATGAIVSGLPPGVSGTFANDTVTINGMPSVIGTFHYTVILMGGCGNVTASGTIVVDPCTGVEELIKDPGWMLYPNPSAGILTIQAEPGRVFYLTDVSGRVLHTYKNATEIMHIDISPGMYFIYESQSRTVWKVIVIK
jgi:hypothetical protein